MSESTIRQCVKCACAGWDKRWYNRKCTCGHSMKSHPPTRQITENQSPSESSNRSDNEDIKGLTIVYDEPGDFSRVDIAGSFNNWKWQPMSKSLKDDHVLFQKTVATKEDREVVFHFRLDDGEEAISLNYKTKIDKRGMVNSLNLRH
ncbi:hypothetical protein RCL1_007041 [Eukaryota sp. TZLM3-RCL]